MLIIQFKFFCSTSFFVIVFPIRNFKDTSIFVLELSFRMLINFRVYSYSNLGKDEWFCRILKCIVSTRWQWIFFIKSKDNFKDSVPLFPAIRQDEKPGPFLWLVCCWILASITNYSSPSFYPNFRSAVDLLSSPPHFLPLKIEKVTKAIVKYYSCHAFVIKFLFR
jgi:hypothetical protein